MLLAHRFTLPAHLDVVWPVFSSLELISPCVPGATVTEISGDDFSGTVKVKFGPEMLTYDGGGTFVTRDSRARELVIKTQGSDERGNGTATTTVTATFTAKLDHTEVSVETDLGIIGKPSQLGKGVVADVCNRLVDQFVACISLRLEDGLGTVGYVEGGTPTLKTRPADDRNRSFAARPRTVSAVSGQTARTQQRSHLDMITAVGGPLAKRYGRYVGVMAAVFVVVKALRS